MASRSRFLNRLFYKATATEPGREGLVPAPAAGDEAKFLRGDATWAAAGGGGSLSVAEYVESQTSGTDGGTFTTGAWRTRTLNTEAFDPDNIATLSGNQISITNAGTYLIQYSAPAFNVTAHRARLYDITGSVEVATGGAGGAESMSSTSAVATRSEGWALVTIAATRVYELQHYSYTTKATNGFGSSTTLGTEIYSRVLVIKVA
jgi:hypothetical protein